MANYNVRKQALLLRKKGASISEISETTHAPKSTVSYWCKDISLTEKQIFRLAEKQRDQGAVGRLKSSELKRKLRIENTNKAHRDGESDLGIISERDRYILGLGLYWGEGYKNGNGECGLTNSDPAIIVQFIEWMKHDFAISQERFTLRVTINSAHEKRIAEIVDYWSSITKIPTQQFTKTSLITAKARKTYLNEGGHYGTLRVKIKNGTNLQRRICGSIQKLQRVFNQSTQTHGILSRTV